MVSCLWYMAMVIPLLRCALTMLRTGAQYAVHVDSTGIPKWEDWTAIALCAVPEVHELPLVDNITSNNIVYYKSQRRHRNDCRLGRRRFSRLTIHSYR